MSGSVSNNNNKNNNHFVVRPVSATSQMVYDIPFSSVIRAWIDCEQKKRTANSCTKFRWHAARDLVQLWHEMCTATYKPRTSTVFMVKYPVLREVWAGAFRDRVVHHWENLRFGPVIEDYFKAVGNRSMNCRKGYGSLVAIAAMERAIYEFTEHYTRQDCWIVGGDFANFFMSIDKTLLWDFLVQLMTEQYTGSDLPALLYLMRETLFHRCQDNFVRKSPESMWRDLPPRKSLFHMDGMPIGNLPSQIWANLMGAVFTDWVVHYKKVEGFVIFVDDWRCLVHTREEGVRLIKEFRQYLSEVLHITLHPDKIYLQHYTKGTKMVGAVLKPACYKPSHLTALRKWVLRGLDQRPVALTRLRKWLTANLPSRYGRQKPAPASRTYIANRTRGHFIDSMIDYKRRAEATNEAGRIALLEKLRASINSYLGMMIHHKSYKVRRKICEKYILPAWGKYLYFVEDFGKCVLRRQYDKIHVVRRKLHSHRYAAKFIRPKWSPDK